MANSKAKGSNIQLSARNLIPNLMDPDPNPGYESYTEKCLKK